MHEIKSADSDLAFIDGDIKQNKVGALCARLRQRSGARPCLPDNLKIIGALEKRCKAFAEGGMIVHN